ncbi:uncharacterized protein PHALS_09529 [Plasmopara halstedii]|uniref:Uncharacterized protein n=1 Tax=Plasmopara halstedii TaxID=4781 RepID=A0A0P1A4E9_PLAHL|nr:uncharacterized protein PHALS_09529 [Plasmopara halstedii]CEG35407.1 hypothetical protein PHALS_09529 [Plasmopara halstedii]|eukprot:XP_024571776.1 hypothetical protein PHALS_09529 [Plasmopara halstedii]
MPVSTVSAGVSTIGIQIVTTWCCKRDDYINTYEVGTYQLPRSLAQESGAQHKVVAKIDLNLRAERSKSGSEGTVSEIT